MITSHDLPTLNMIVQQIDLGYITPSDAKRRVNAYTGHDVKGRTREQVIRAIGQIIREYREANNQE